MKKHTFIVSIEVDATKIEAAEYIRTAVREYGLSHPPESDFFGLEESQVMVKPAFRNDIFKGGEIPGSMTAHGKGT